jgi:uncharacterized protein (TIGR00369 family)
MRAIQDLYPDDFAHCYGCGRLNPSGLHIRTEWREGEGVALLLPDERYVALPGFVYGGLVASLVDCHAIGTAAAAAMLAAGLTPGHDPSPRFVTASLTVDYLKPTPAGCELEARARPVEVGARKVVVEVSVEADGEVRARGRVVAVRLPASMAGGTHRGAE